MTTTTMSDVRVPGPVRRHVDGTLLAIVALLVSVGLLVSYTASYAVGDQYFADGMYFLKRQILWSFVGIVVAAVILGVDHRTWQHYSVPIMAGTLIVLAVMLVVGASRFGGQRWLLGSGSIQPSEVAKLTVILYIADWLSNKGKAIRDVTLGLIPFAIMMGLVCGLIILQTHLSTAVLIGAVAIAMFFTAGADLRQMLASAAIALSVLTLVILRSPYRMERVRTFIDPTGDPSGAGFQVMQTLDAIMRGGVLGVGLGSGQQKHIIPLPHTDSVFAVLGEELGVVGCLTVLALFALLAWRGFRIAAALPDRFGSLLALGVTCWITGQALINIAVVTAFAPFTGIPLPFISYGGSSLVACLAGVGILLNLSRRVDPRLAGTHAYLDLRRGNRRSRLSRDHRARSRAPR